MVKKKKIHGHGKWLNAYTAISVAFEFAAKYVYGNTEIGFELKADDGRRYDFVMHSSDITLERVQKKTGLHDFSCLKSITVFDLRDKEYEITEYGIKIKKGYQKLYDLLKDREYGEYVVINEEDIFKIDYKKTYDGIMYKRTFEDFEEVVKRLGNAITRNLKVLYIPEYHMYKICSLERYPDDPGCGICDYYVKIFDKATGVEYIQ